MFLSKKAGSGDAMAAKKHVEEKVHANKVAVFSKSYCPYCKCAWPCAPCTILLQVVHQYLGASVLSILLVCCRN